MLLQLDRRCRGEKLAENGECDTDERMAAQRFSRLILGDSSLRIATKSCKTIALPPPLPGVNAGRKLHICGGRKLHTSSR